MVGEPQALPASAVEAADFRLDGKVVAVTGAGRGIGRAIAREAARAGANVAACSRSPQDLASVQREVHDLGRECETVECDITVDGAMDDFVARTVSAFDRLDGFVNNAGHNILRDALDYSEQEVSEILGLNLAAVYWGCVAAARQMIDQGAGGAIVNISSRAGLIGNPGRAPYSAAKAGVNNLTKTLSGELARHGIRVNAVAPGLTATPLAEAFLADHEAEATRMLEAIPIGRFAHAREIALPTIFLLSGAASMVTGHVLVVDGGWSAI